MNVRSPHTRRAFLGMAAAAAAIPAAISACTAADGTGGAAPAGPPQAVTARRRVSENSLAGDPHWDISHPGQPGAMLGYAGQASVLPGARHNLWPPIRL